MRNFVGKNLIEKQRGMAAIRSVVSNRGMLAGRVSIEPNRLSLGRANFRVVRCDRGFRSARTRFGAYFRPSYLLGRAGKSIQKAYKKHTKHTKSIQKHTESIQKHTKAYKSIQKHTKAYKSKSIQKHTNQSAPISSDRSELIPLYHNPG